MRAWKLFKLRKDGTLGSLFINSSAVIPVGKWMWAKDYPTKGFAHRPGWHCTLRKSAPHLSMKGRVWARVEVKFVEEFERPKEQGGKWLLARRLKVLEVCGG